MYVVPDSNTYIVLIVVYVTSTMYYYVTSTTMLLVLKLCEDLIDTCMILPFIHTEHCQNDEFMEGTLINCIKCSQACHGKSKKNIYSCQER